MVLAQVVEVLGQIEEQYRSRCLVTVRQCVLKPDCRNLCSRGVDLVPSGELRSGLGSVAGTWLGGPSLVILGVVGGSVQNEVAHAIRGPGLKCEFGMAVHQLPN